MFVGRRGRLRARGMLRRGGRRVGACGGIVVRRRGRHPPGQQLFARGVHTAGKFQINERFVEAVAVPQAGCIFALARRFAHLHLNAQNTFHIVHDGFRNLRQVGLVAQHRIDGLERGFEFGQVFGGIVCGQSFQEWTEQQRVL